MRAIIARQQAGRNFFQYRLCLARRAVGYRWQRLPTTTLQPQTV